MSSREFRPCRTFCPARINTHKMFDKENKNIDICQSSTGNYLTAAQYVRQSAEGWPDILSCMPEIIFAITELSMFCDQWAPINIWGHVANRQGPKPVFWGQVLGFLDFAVISFLYQCRVKFLSKVLSNLPINCPTISLQFCSWFCLSPSPNH